MYYRHKNPIVLFKGHLGNCFLLILIFLPSSSESYSKFKMATQGDKECASTSTGKMIFFVNYGMLSLI
jgi:hypothetical protein